MPQARTTNVLNSDEHECKPGLNVVNFGISPWLTSFDSLYLSDKIRSLLSNDKIIELTQLGSIRFEKSPSVCRFNSFSNLFMMLYKYFLNS